MKKAKTLANILFLLRRLLSITKHFAFANVLFMILSRIKKNKLKNAVYRVIKFVKLNYVLQANFTWKDSIGMTFADSYLDFPINIYRRIDQSAAS